MFAISGSLPPACCSVTLFFSDGCGQHQMTHSVFGKKPQKCNKCVPWEEGWIYYRLLFRPDNIAGHTLCTNLQIIRGKLSEILLLMAQHTKQSVFKSRHSSCKILWDKWLFQLNLHCSVLWTNSMRWGNWIWIQHHNNNDKIVKHLETTT